MKRRGQGLHIKGTPKLTNSSRAGVHPSMSGAKTEKLSKEKVK